MSLPVRPYRPSDAPFVIDAWKRSLETAPGFRGADREHYRVEADRMITRLLARGECRIAYNPADDDHLIGFAAYCPDPDYGRGELHFVYVKRDFRGKGIAKRLLEGLQFASYTFLTPSIRPPKGWAYTPRWTIE